jgi:signal transduction histidine kinase
MNRDDCPRLLSLAVHEFRTPVTVVAGYLRMLLKMQSGLPDQSLRLLEEAEKSCGRLAALIAELSELSNVEAGHVPLDRRDVDLFGLLAEVAASVQEGADRGVTLKINRPVQRGLVSADPKFLARALDSLLTATLRERAQPGDVVSSCGVDGASNPGRAYIVIAPADDTDAHAGFDQSDWAPFDQWRGGVGFRLVLAQQVIASHGGAVFSGRGQRARAACALTLPLKESAS